MTTEAKASSHATPPISHPHIEPHHANSQHPPPPPTNNETHDAHNAANSGFRRPRASRACETCHSRKVRCDAASLGIPCTNCVAFDVECRVASPKRKKTSAKRESDSDRAESFPPNHSPATTNAGTPTSATASASASAHRDTAHPRAIAYNSPGGMPPTELDSKEIETQRTNVGAYAQYMKPKFARAPIKEAGRVAYLGESSNLALLVRDTHGADDVVHYPLPDSASRDPNTHMTELDDLEVRILTERGAFLLPPRQLCDELVDDFFTWIAPVVPVINKTRFMRRYKDPNNPPSLLLLQAILLAGSRVCKNPQLMDANGSTTPAALTFYNRAKALYESNYEDDRVTIVQALTLLAWHWDSSVEDVTKNVFYWTRVAIVVAQGSGMHRSVEKSQLTRQDKRLWKRIWWTLFTRDRSVAVALGRPVGINIDDSDVEMLTEQDFVETEEDSDQPSEYQTDQVHIQFFLTYVKLCEIMGLVLSQNYGVGPQKNSRIKAIDLTHCDMALADWLQHCPREVFWERRNHHFWAALLHSNYYTTLCLLHRAHMPPAGIAAMRKATNGLPEETAYPSKNIAYQAAGMITSIVEALLDHDQLRFTPAFIVYSLFSALIMHVYQMRSSNPEIVQLTQKRLASCMHGLREVSKVWLIAKMVHTLFESILGNKTLEEKLQKAAGKRHGKDKASTQQQNNPNTVQPRSINQTLPQKRKLGDFDVGFSGPPAAKMSYERSHPVSPAATPGRELNSTHTQAQQMPSSSPMIPQAGNESFAQQPQGTTRQTSPFNDYSYPGTPPDLFLHTRNSPNISQDLWQNYQPEQLFPPDAPAFMMASPQHELVDPALQPGSVLGVKSPLGTVRPNMSMPPTLQGNMMPGPDTQAPGSVYQMNDLVGQQVDALSGIGPDDAWVNPLGEPIPSTLNVGDWLEFFSIANNNGDVNLPQPLAQQ